MAVRFGLLFGVACAAAVACAQPQPAPPPREVPVQTDAELLVGRWRMVKFGVRPARPIDERITIFAKDGTFSTTRCDLRLPVETRTGTYKVVGDSISFKVEVPEMVSGSMRILLVTKSELVLQLGPDENLKRVEYCRDEVK